MITSILTVFVTWAVVKTSKLVVMAVSDTVAITVTLVEASVSVVSTRVLASFRLLPPIFHTILIDNHFGAELMLNPGRTRTAVQAVRVTWTISLTADSLSMTLGLTCVFSSAA